MAEAFVLSANDVTLLRDVIAWKRGQYMRIGKPKAHEILSASATSIIRHGILRTDLLPRPMQSLCIIEERAYDDTGALVCNEKLYLAWHPRGEYWGYADWSEVDWIVETDSKAPTATQLDDLEIALPAGAPEATEPEIACIIDISCDDFEGQCDNTPTPAT
jgi:hypothetical protein